MTAGIFILYALGLCLYFTPAFLAAGKKRNSTAIFGLNLLLGWTVLGWIGALVWALSKDDPQPTAEAIENAPTGNIVDEIERLKNLHEAGHITAEQFEKGKETILSR